MALRQRRRARTFAPEMLDAVREALASGASAREVVQAIARMQAKGQLHDGGAPLATPSESTVKNIAREMVRDESAAWTLADSDPASAVLVLRVLGAVVAKSRGRIRHLTRREAQLAAVFLATRPGIDGTPRDQQAWKAYVRARSYIALLNRGDDPSEAHLELATFAEIERDLEYRPGMVDAMLKTDPPLEGEHR